MDRQTIRTPHNPEAEKTLIAACLANPEKASEIVEMVKASDFLNPRDAGIFAAIEKLVEEKQPVEAAGIYSHTPDVGNAEYLFSLLEYPATAPLEYYAGLVVGESKKRQMIARLDESREKCFSGKTCDEVLDFCHNNVLSVQVDSESGCESFNDLMHQAVDDYEAIISGRVLPGVMTGFNQLDGILGGLQKTDLIILAARPSMGKTAFILNLVFTMQRANMEKVPTAVYSLEMSKKQLAQRAISSEALINLHFLRRGKLDPDECSSMVRASERLASYPVFIEDKSSMTVPQIARSARRIKKKYGLGLVVIDYLQLLGGEKKENRTQEVTGISRALKNMAKDLDVPVIALSQLNRSLEQRADKRPILSDLRESGSIEQDADIVMFIYRDEVYNKDADNPAKGTAEILVAKQRNGPIGKVFMAFNNSCARFTDLATGGYNG